MNSPTYKFFTQIEGRPETKLALGNIDPFEDRLTTDDLVFQFKLPRHRVMRFLACHTCKELVAILFENAPPLEDMMKKRGASFEELSEEEKNIHLEWAHSDGYSLFEGDGTDYQDPNDDRTGGFVTMDETRQTPVEVEITGPDIAPGIEDDGSEAACTFDAMDAVLVAEKILQTFAPYKLSDGVFVAEHDRVDLADGGHRAFIAKPWNKMTKH